MKRTVNSDGPAYTAGTVYSTVRFIHEEQNGIYRLVEATYDTASDGNFKHRKAATVQVEWLQMNEDELEIPEIILSGKRDPKVYDALLGRLAGE